MLRLLVVLASLYCLLPLHLPQALAQPLHAGWTLETAIHGIGGQGIGGNEAVWQREVDLPAPWEQHLGNQFDGKGTYRYTFSETATRSINHRLNQANQTVPHELILRLEGVATQATVYLNGTQVGQHTGAWTPWECDLETAWSRSGPNELEIRVDEKVGHHTQGFLPIIAPHFGGIWKNVSLQIKPTFRILEDQSMALGRHRDTRDEIQCRIKFSQPFDKDIKFLIQQSAPTKVKVPDVEDLDQLEFETWDSDIDNKPFLIDDITVENGIHSFSIPVENARLWSCEAPWLYKVSVTAVSETETGDYQPVCSANFQSGIRSIETRDNQLLLNGKTIHVRGLLNWGYSPPSTAPSLDPNAMFQELQLLRSLDLNLMKFCLYMPPQRYLELCDQLGVLAWLEYPTWHAQLVPENLEALSSEYSEFTDYDRNHPSVILRSLTCETGSSADLSVIQQLYDLVHNQVPGCVVEDDSSWISWNRVSDFWDDHPYGNNHTWIPTLERLKDHIRANGAKPLILGEAIAADTWPLPPSENPPFGENSTRADFHLNSREAATAFTQQLSRYLGDHVVQDLYSDSVDYAALMRKFQIEVYRREVPYGGFVLSVIRDFPLAPMGLLDQFGEEKFAQSRGPFSIQAPQHHLLLETENDRRSLQAGQVASVKVYLATPDPDAFADRKIQLEVLQDGQTLSKETVVWQAPQPGADELTKQVHQQAAFSIVVPNDPGPFNIKATTVDNENESVNTEVSNEWKLWAIPAPPTVPELKFHLHQSLVINPQWEATLQAQGIHKTNSVPLPEAELIIAAHWDRELWQQLRQGARVLMFPDGKANSFVVRDHWFLRGGPIADTLEFSNLDDNRLEFRKLLVELQHFDLAGPVQADFDFWPETSPLLMLWDTHDIAEVKTHGLAWLANVDQGRLAVTTLNHSPDQSAAGPYVLSRILSNLISGSPESSRSFSNELIQRLERELSTTELNLTSSKWKLKRDPDQQGYQLNWHRPETSDADWDDIRIDAHWEGQGQDGLDGWAWYSTTLTIPKEWETEALYLSFTGVDDHYIAYVNGQEIGSAGNVETKETAFEMRSSYRLPADLKPGDTLTVRIAVYDWYGAGGIFRPIFLRTTPLSEQPPILQR